MKKTKVTTLPGGIFNGLRTTAGIDTQREQLKISKVIMHWVEKNQQRLGTARSMTVNKLLAKAIKSMDPAFRSDVD